MAFKKLEKERREQEGTRFSNDGAYMTPMWQNVLYFYQYFSMCIILKNIIFKKNLQKAYEYFVIAPQFHHFMCITIVYKEYSSFVSIYEKIGIITKKYISIGKQG